MSESLSKKKYVHTFLFQLPTASVELYRPKTFISYVRIPFPGKKETHIFIPNASVELYRAKMLFEPFNILFMLKHVSK